MTAPETPDGSDIAPVTRSGAARSVAPILSADRVTKRFGATVALADVSFDLYAREIHGLIGENGAGKSTLTRLLAGVHRPDDGALVLEGQRLAHWSPDEALSVGVVTVHQDVNLVETMTIADNVFLNDEIHHRFGLDRRAMARETTRLLEEFEILARAHDLVAALPTDQRKMIQLARAMRRRPKVLLLDEPTSALTAAEVEILVRQVHRVAGSGVAVLYISHYLDEVFAHTDRLTILKDGRSVWSGRTRDIKKDEAIASMIGGRVAARRRRAAADADGPPVLAVEGLTLGERLRGVSFFVRQGEILGVGGLAGAGLGPLARALFGDPLFRPTGGRILVGGARRDWRHPADAMAAGLALVTNDRHVSGALVDFSIADNVALPSLKRLSGRLGAIDRPRYRNFARAAVEWFGVRTSSPFASLSTLSGGNQQKVMLAKWFMTEPKVLILDEPTLGVDVGAKGAIKALVEERAAQGCAVVWLTSEMGDIAELADRAIVLFRGRICARFDERGFTETALARVAHNPDLFEDTAP